MLHLIRISWRKIAYPVIFTIVMITVLSCILSSVLAKNYSLQYELESWEIGTEFISLLYPIFTVIPVCWNLYYERKDNFLMYVAPRTSIKRYLIAKWISYAVGVALIIIIPSVISTFFVLYIKEPIVPCTNNPFCHIFAEIFIETPWIYIIFLSLWRAFLAVLMMTLGFVLALFCRNIFVVLISPFVYSIMENFILSILHLESYRLVTAFDPTNITPRAIIHASFIVGPVLLIITVGIVALVLSRKNKIVTV